MKTSLFAVGIAAALLMCEPGAKAVEPPPLPAASSTFAAGSLRVQVYGKAGMPALVFIPGLTCGPWEWSGEIARFAPKYQIYALTLPGFDGAPSISGPLFNTVAADFWTMLDAHNVQRPIVVGHSLGGTLGILLAEQHSNRLRAVVAVDGLPVFPGTENQTATQRAQSAARMSSMLSALSTPQQFAAAESTYVLPYMISAPSDIATVAKLTARSDAKAAAAWMSEDLTTDSRSELPNVHLPLLEIAPYDPTLEKAHFATAQAKRGYYAALLASDPTAQVQVIEPSRHFMMYDQPEKLDAALQDFFATLR